MFAYKAYGLAIVCDLELPELPELELSRAGSPAELRVTLRGGRRFDEPAEWLPAPEIDGAPWLKCARTPDGYFLRYPEMADFLVDARGCEIECAAVSPGISPAGLRHLLLDQVLPRVLNLRGREALHATAIAAGSGVCAFLGAAGTGKSTLAASFQLDGYASVCDDCLVLNETSGAVLATPGYPGVRLWEDSLEALAMTREAAVPVAGYVSKFRLLGTRTPERFCDREYPLARIYLLARDESGALAAPRIRAVSPAEAFPAMVRASFPLDFADPAMLERHFRTLTKVANSVPVRALEFPADFAALPDVRRAIFRDLDTD
jgi:hypothetical protein